MLNNIVGRITLMWVVLILIITFGFAPSAHASPMTKACVTQANKLKELVVKRDEGRSLAEMVVPGDIFNSLLIRFVFSEIGWRHHADYHHYAMLMVCMEYGGDLDKIRNRLHRLLGDIQT